MVKIDIWSDVICPFCYLGAARLEAAIKKTHHEQDVELHLHSFELDPNAPKYQPGDDTLVQMVAHKYHVPEEQAAASQEKLAASLKQVGLNFDWKQAKPTNTFMAHRLIHYAQKFNLDLALDKNLKTAYLSEGEDVSDPDVLKRHAQAVGLTNTDEIDKVLSSDEYGDAVRADEARAHQLGITGVPFYLINDKYTISGAQPVELFEQALNQVYDEQQNIKPQPLDQAGQGKSCDGDGCSI
ncbi:hypothetical protein BGL34_04060 [Fructilactobacillus lindneri]|uniref:DSBA oxidoreductase n=2 Tax=Fructilactobacillus lindneri TaxID=53444 RepID=A0A0R2JNY5_9LACO|nr:DsbA family oxidoreductase [Fructilactobacillus lindneri]ANZ57708.1 hypothetical protein AYR60_02480 [Fructilactobacillus lindneri]ANZ58978.1 hypothetical protein AYR59_02480 [Fructilactobacillus lindneri]KRN78857.1 DSBA oxidoreductase [Fructilactobacillus lindneri DSM 20690 = JCM 11027]POG98003.1 hypothetical protein BGL31_04695 [Fructilactobacillus lindneri]POG99099.1 hypothetical protein BGL32_06090 [Fructilactobacillus lindneri]